MRRLSASVAATAGEAAANRAGDDIVNPADVVMDRAFTLDASPDQVWPWLVQLGKHRAGWYLPRSIERFIPRTRRAIRSLDPRWQGLAVGDVIPDYGGRHATFEVASIEPPHALVYTSQRSAMQISWSLTLTSIKPRESTSFTRVNLRLRLGQVRRRWLANTIGEMIDALTVVGLAAGLRERVSETMQRLDSPGSDRAD